MGLLHPAIALIFSFGTIAGGVEPLASQGEQATAINHALQALSRGDVRPLSALPTSAFTAPIALADPLQNDIERRWTAFLAQAIARIPVSDRAQVLLNLDAVQRRLGDAAMILPAPLAVAQLRAIANRAYDHGNFRDFLAASAPLAEIVATQVDERIAIADGLLGVGPVVDPLFELHAPALGQGTAIPSPPSAGLTADSADAGLTVRWHASPGWLLACDQSDQVLWQHRTSRNATILIGIGGALVRDVDGSRMLDERGTVFALPPLPKEAVALGVRGGAVWFHADTRIWRLDLASHAVGGFTLTRPPLAAPIVRGTRSLWLTADHLLLVDQLTVSATWRIHAGPDWTLVDHWPQSSGVGLRSPDGVTVPVLRLDELLAHQSPAEQARSLATAERPEEALAALRIAETTAHSPPATIVSAHLALGPLHVREHWQAIAAQAVSAGMPQAEATTLAVALPDPLAESRLRKILAADPSLLVPPTDGTPPTALDQPAWWNHVILGDAWLNRDARSTVRGGWQRTLNDQPESIPLPIPTFLQTTHDGSLVGTQGTVRSLREDAFLTIICADPHAHDQWRQRWPTLPGVEAPSTTLIARDSVLFVLEGDTRITALDLADGTVLARHPLPNGASSPRDLCLPAPGIIALLGPAGIDRTVWILGADGTQRIDLPEPARFLLPLGGRAVAISDQRAIAAPDLTPVTLPKALFEGPRAQRVHDGFQQGGRLYRWR